MLFAAAIYVVVVRVGEDERIVKGLVHVEEDGGAETRNR